MLSYTVSLLRKTPVRRCVRLYRRRRGGLSSHIPIITKGVEQQKPIEKKTKINAPSSNLLDTKKMVSIDGTREMEDILVHYLEHINSGFKKSMKAINNLKSELKLLDQRGDKNSKISVILNFLIRESSIEINRLLNLGPEKVQEVIEKGQRSKISNINPNNEEQLESAIIEELFLSNDNNSPSLPLANTEMLVSILSDMSKHTWEENSSVITLEQLADIFEIAKQVPENLIKRRALYFSAKVLYDSKKVRMDPVNESFYIDTLVFFGKYNEALKLFNSNKDKVKQRWWNELGMMITLRSNQIGAFNYLLHETDSEYGDGTYLHPKIIRIAIKRYLTTRNISKANEMSDRLLQMIDILGVSNKIEDTDIINLQSLEDAEIYLNEVEIPSVSDILIIIKHHIHWKNTEKAYDLLAKYLVTAADIDNDYRICISKLKLILLKDLDELENALYKRIDHDICKQITMKLDQTLSEEKATLKIDKRISSQILYDKLNKLGDKKQSGIEKLLNYTKKELMNIKSQFANSKPKVEKEVYYNVLKLLLANNEEEKAYMILSVLEDMNRNYLVANQKDGMLNSHHYALFINYYNNKLITARKKFQYEEKVLAIIEKLKNNKIAPSPEFWSNLIAYYRSTNRFDNAFDIINNLLAQEKYELEDQTDGIPMESYERKTFNLKLYTDIWITYAKYFHLIASTSLNGVEIKQNKLSYLTKKILTGNSNLPLLTSRELFFLMTVNDNIIPTPHLYIRVIKVFLKQNDLEGLMAVIVSMYSRHDYTISSSVQQYIIRGLDQIFFLIKKSKLEPEEQSTVNMARELRILKDNGILLDFRKMEEVHPNAIVNEIRYLLDLKYEGQSSMEQIRNAFNEMGVSLSPT
ncbi:hypothetical protein RNJ44_04680 [Nakaseomyces bracarensis]|uniref:Mitochondrial group I intron splicing factor CCM1 n=1 Tax=Nakaseomyces bracarensis TaxID=273131 RepID=A0ABR4NVL4_9SACH